LKLAKTTSVVKVPVALVVTTLAQAAEEIDEVPSADVPLAIVDVTGLPLFVIPPLNVCGAVNICGLLIQADCPAFGRESGLGENCAKAGNAQISANPRISNLRMSPLH